MPNLSRRGWFAQLVGMIVGAKAAKAQPIQPLPTTSAVDSIAFHLERVRPKLQNIFDTRPQSLYMGSYAAGKSEAQEVIARCLCCKPTVIDSKDFRIPISIHKQSAPRQP